MVQNFVVTCLLLILISFSAYSQVFPKKNHFKFGINAELGTPINDPSKDLYKFGIGINANSRFGLIEELNLTASAGFLKFIKDSYEDEYLIYNIPAISAIPLRVGLLYKILPYLYAQLETGSVIFVNSGSGNAFIYTPSIGLNFKNFDVSLKIETWTGSSTMQYAGFRMGYYF